MSVQHQQAPDGWQALYRRAFNEARDLTNFVESRPDLRIVEKRLAKIEEDARALAAAPAITAATSAQAEPPKRDREADRAWFPDPAFNRWLDEGISDAGHTVWDQVGSVVDAWHGWNNRPFYDAAQAEPTLCHRNPAPNASQPMVPTPSLTVTIGVAVQAEPQVPAQPERGCGNCALQFVDTHRCDSCHAQNGYKNWVLRGIGKQEGK